MVTRAPPDPRQWDPVGIEGWDGTFDGARKLQTALAGTVALSDGFRVGMRTVAGFGTISTGSGERIRAAGVVLDAQTLQPLHQHVHELDSRIPYMRGLLGFRLLPALLDLLDALPYRPDLVFIDGHGIAHPRRCGLATHFGVASGLPTIGVCASALVGEYAEPGPAPSDRTRLFDGDQQIGWVLRLRADANPVFVSPGHRVSLASALELTLRYHTRHRLPEPTWRAGRLLAQRAPTHPWATTSAAGAATSRLH